MSTDVYVEPDWLQLHLDDLDVRVLESSIEKKTYEDGHIAGALWVDPHRDMLRNGDESSGDVLTPEQFASLMRRLGITPATTVVWYGDRHSVFAMRGLWTMDFYRHPSPVHILQGGRERWLAEKRPMTREVTERLPSDYPVPRERDESNRATYEQVRAAIDDPGARILDVRALDEYTGKNVRAARGGHIPGAANIEWTEATAGENVLKSPDELRAMYEAQGVTPDRAIITHCQLGIRAAHTWFVLKHVLGYPSVRNYDGSWQEWGNREDAPIDR
jgi:thiosulfate/3-mercaptopyruvate sulfurtransferase